MDNFNTENQNGVFGGVGFEQNNNTTTDTNANTYGEVKQQANASSVFGNFSVPSGINNANGNMGTNTDTNFRPIAKEKAITKQGLWTKIKAFLFQEIDLTAPIKVELTPYQQKVEDEINEFLHQDVSFKNIAKLFGKK